MAEQTYTLSQAAASLAFREDTVVALLSEAGIDLTKRSPATITQAEMDRLSKAAQAIKDHKDELNY